MQREKNILLLLFLAFGVCAEELCFVQLTDTHFGNPEHRARAETAVEAINALPFDVQFVAVTGDVMSDNITDSSAVDEAVAVLGKLDAPVHYLAGNHDIKQGDLKNTLDIYRKRFGPLSERHVYAGVECVFVYTEPLARGFSVEGYDLFAVFGQCGDGPILLFHHAASVSDFYKNRIHSGWADKEARVRWQALLKEKGVDAVIAGHFHRAELHWIGNIPVYIAPSIAGYWGRQGSFRIYYYENGRLTYRTQYIP